MQFFFSVLYRTWEWVWVKQLGPALADWPLMSEDQVFSIMLLGLIPVIAALCLHTVTFCGESFEREKKPRITESRPGMWVTRADRKLVRLHHWYFGKYPMNICPYAWLNAVMFTIFFIAALGLSLWAVPFTSMVWYIIRDIPGMIMGAPEVVVDMGRGLVGFSTNQYTLWGVSIVLLALIFRFLIWPSRPMRFLRVRIRAYYDRKCVPVCVLVD